MQSVILKALGLITNPNELSVSPGALYEAINIIMLRSGLIQSRNGWTYIAKASTYHRAMFPYDGTIIADLNTTAIAHIDPPTWVANTGLITAPDNEGGIRMQAAEASKNLYLTSTTGIKRLSGKTGTVREAGLPRGLGLDRFGRYITSTTGNVVRAGTTVTVTTTTPHYFEVGEWVNMSNVADPNFAAGVKQVVSVIGATSFTYTEAGSATSSSEAHYFKFILLVSVAASGFLEINKQVAYRTVFAYKDAKGTTHYGAPSSRVVIGNNVVTDAVGYTGTSINVTCRGLIPSGLDSACYFQVYRSAQVPVGQAIDDDLQLVYQDYLTQGDIDRGFFQFMDVMPDVGRGAFLYTAPSAPSNKRSDHRGEIGFKDGENALPPYAEDICKFKDRLWLFRTISCQRYPLSILAVGGSAGIQNNDVLVVNGVSFTAKTTVTPGVDDQYQLVTTGTPSQNNEATALNLVESINRHTGAAVYAYYQSGPDDAPGMLTIEGRYPSTTPFQVLVTHGSKRTCFNPIASVATCTPITLTRAAAGTTVIATVASPLTAHSFRIGEQVYISPGNASFPAGNVTITAVTASTFKYEGPTDTGLGPLTTQSAALATTTSSYSTNDNFPNGVAFSKAGEHEAFPLKNFLKAGTESSTLLRGVALADQIVLVMTDGIWKVVGDDIDNFAIIKVNDTVHPISRSAVSALDNAVYVLCSEGVAKVSATGQYNEDTGLWSGQFSMASDPIQPTLLATIRGSLIATGPVAIMTYAFAYASAVDHLLTVWLPTNANRRMCATGFTLNSKTGAWSTCATYSETDALSCGCYDPVTGKIYLGDSYVSGGASFTWVERRAGTAADLRDDIVLVAATPTFSTVGISKTVTYVFETADAPAMLKRFSEICAMFIGTPAAISVAYANEYGSAGAAHSLSSNGSQAFRDYVMANATLGTRLRVTITHSVAGEAFDLAGLSIKFEVLGTSVSR